MQNSKARAPGKILWLGGYSVLERPNISFVTAVNAYVNAELIATTDPNVVLNAPQLEMSADLKLDISSGRLIGDVPKELLLLKTSVEVALRYAASIGISISGLDMMTKNDAAFAYGLSTGKVVKSGLGSSAAVTVASIAAVLKAFGVDPKQHDALHKLAQTAHSIATGKVGSGFDIAAACHGSILYTRYSPEIVKSLPTNYTNQQLMDLVNKDWDYRIERFPLPKNFRLSFANFGESMVTTKAIGSVSEFKAKNPSVYNELISKLNDENLKAVEALRRINEGADEFEAFRVPFDNGRMISKKLGEESNVGIEPDDCTELIEQSKEYGALVAKLPGAGGKDAIAALSTDELSYNALQNFWKCRKELSIMDIRAVDEGVL